MAQHTKLLLIAERYAIDRARIAIPCLSTVFDRSVLSRNISTVEFLGQQICRGGMTPMEAKLKALRDWATPKDVKGVRSFLRFANYY